MIGINAQITSQLTQDEILEYMGKVLAKLGEATDPNVRAQVLGTLVATCGRPIAKVELEQIAEAQAMVRSHAQLQQAAVTERAHQRPAIDDDSPFRSPS